MIRQKIFDGYTEKVCKLFDIGKEQLFQKCKKREVVDARHMLYFLCAKRGMRLTYIQKHMKRMGYDISHSSIHHGIAVTLKMYEADRDYSSIIDEIDVELLMEY